MNADALSAALANAQTLHNFGKFGPLQQAEFFREAAAAIAEPDPVPDPEPAPEAAKAKAPAKSTKG